MNIKIIKWIIFFLLGVFFQSIIIDNLLAIKGVRPDIILLMLIFFGLGIGEIYPIIIGFFVGFIQGLGFLGDGFIGLSALTKSITGFYITLFYKSNKKWNDRYFLMIILTSCLIHNSIYYYIYMF